MNMTLYKLTELEQWINHHYQKHGIHQASDMDIEQVASTFNAEVHYFNGRSFVDYKDGEYCYIVLNGYLRTEQKREQFFHELCHPLKHAGAQRYMPEAFVQLQEIQANLFQMYAALPAFMLEEFKNISLDTYVKVVAEEFQYTETFVEKRLKQIQGRIDQERRDQVFMHQKKVFRYQKTYSDETKRLLDQLQRQLKAKG